MSEIFNPLAFYGFCESRSFEGLSTQTITVDENDKIITINNDVISATLNLDYDNGVLSLVGKDGEVISTINLPKSEILKSVSYDENTHILTLVFNTTEGEENTVTVDLSGLVDSYTAGDGIEINEQKAIQIKINPNSSEVLSTDSEGLSFDGKMFAKQEDLVTVNENLATSVQTLNDNLVQTINTINGGIEADRTTNNEKFTAIDTKLENIDTQLGDMANKVDDATNKVATVEQGLADEISRATLAETNLGGKIDNEISRATLAETNLAAKIDQIHGVTPEEVSAAVQVETERATEAENKLAEEKVSYTVFNKDGEDYKTIALENHANLLGYSTDNTAYNLAMVSKWNKADYGSAQIPFNMNGSEPRPTYNDTKEVALVEDINETVNTIELVQDSTDSLHYQLMVNNVVKGDINIPKDQFLKSASYDTTTKELVFVFETSTGETTTRIDVSSLIDVYTAGNGLTLDNNQFAVKVVDGDRFLNVNENGLSCNFTIEKNAPWIYDLRDKNGTIQFRIDFNPEYDAISEVLQQHASNISAINTNYKNADEVIKQDLTNEVTARGEADTQLQSDLQSEATTARAAEKANADAIIAEKERAEEVESKLRTDVDYESSRALEAEANINKELDRRVTWDESKSKIVLPSGGQLVGTKYGTDGSDPADGAVIAQLSQYDVMDFGSVKFPLNLNVPAGVRPTVQEQGQTGEQANQIAYVSDLSNYVLKSDYEALLARVEALEARP